MVHSTIWFFGDDPLAERDGRDARAEKVNRRSGLGFRMAVVFGCDSIILLAQLQPLLI
jgi:hypothetical protein